MKQSKRKRKNGARIAFDTVNNADWRIYILLAGIVLVCIGIVPIIEPEVFNTLRYIALKKFFVSTDVMSSVYISVGLLMILNLRRRILAFIIPIGILLLGYYIFTQLAIFNYYSYGLLTAGVTCVMMVVASIKGGGFSINSDITDSQLTPKEIESIYITERAIRSVKMANELNREDEFFLTKQE